MKTGRTKSVFAALAAACALTLALAFPACTVVRETDGTDPGKDGTDTEEAAVTSYVVTVTTNIPGVLPSYYVVPEGDAFPAPAEPVLEGYVFTGWYSDPECTAAYDFASGIYSDTVIYAGWEEAVCLVTIDHNYDGAPVDSFEVVAGSALVSLASPKREGYRFTGWYSDPECTAAYDFTSKIYSDTFIYAGWEETPGGE